MRNQTFAGRLPAIFLISALSAASCSRAMFVPPAGPGDPAPDAAAAWSEATAKCRDVRTYSALVTLSGSVRGTRFPGLTVHTALTSDGAAHLQAHASGRQIFLLVGQPDRAWLWLREDHRVVAGAVEAIVQNLADVRLGGDELLRILTGCAVGELEISAARRYGVLIGIETAGGRVFLEQREGVWSARGAVVDGLVVEYRRAGPGLPSDIEVRTIDESEGGVRLRFRAAQVALDDPLAPQVFTLPGDAASADPMTLAELRKSGPLRRAP